MKFGVREICDVTFKATANNQKVGTKVFKKYQPVFSIDTAQTSEMSQESTTVYAQGGKGYNRLIAWEGEKTMTFTVTDALLSPLGLAVLSGAGLIKANEEEVVHVHVTVDAATENGIATIKYADLANEIGVYSDEDIYVCADKNTKIYGTVLDGSGAGIDWVDNVVVTGGTAEAGTDLIAVKKGEELTVTCQNSEGETDTTKNGTVKYDMYVAMKAGATEVTIAPEDFGGYFYVEADTLFRREDNGQDMAATLTFPRVKVQSGFTFTMAASGDPSTFDFTMDAFPGYTQFDGTKKVCVTMAIVGSDEIGSDESASHSKHVSI